MSEFSERLKELRKDAGLSIVELSTAINYSKSIISYWENGIKEPSLNAIVTLSQYFHVTADYLIGLKEYESPTALPVNEREILNLYQSLSPARKEDLKIYLRALSGSSAASTTKKTHR